MSDYNEFKKYVTKHIGISSSNLNYWEQYQNSLTVIDEIITTKSKEKSSI